MAYKCEVKEQPAQPTISIRRRTAVQALPQVFGEVYGAIGQYLAELGEQPAGAPFAAYYNMDMQDLDIEIGFPVSKKLPDRGEIKAGEIPQGEVATCLHIGPYSDIAQAYTALSSWVAENGYEATGVAYEMYLNDPLQTPPQELRTLILYPLKPY